MVLTVHNRERAAVGVQPLVWNDTLAADAKTYAEHLATTGKSDHPSAEWVAAHPMSPEGENIAARYGPPSTVSMAQEMQGWIAEKNVFQGASLRQAREAFTFSTDSMMRNVTASLCSRLPGTHFTI